MEMQSVATIAGKRCCCVTRRLVLQVLDAIFLVAVLILQSSILNYYIIAYYESHIGPYFWFIGDIFILFIFGCTLTQAYQTLTNINGTYFTNLFFLYPQKTVLKKLSVSKFGILPMSYISWFLYSVVLLCKIIMIFKTGIPEMLHPTDFFGTHLLQITIALSGIIFFLLVEGHNWSKRNSPRYLYITSVCSSTGIEILDTVSLLAMLLVNETKFVLTFPLEDSILALSSLNFFLPILELYKLSLSDVSTENLFLPINILYKFLHLCLINIPFLIIRIYMWIYYNYNASLFLMKNVFGIIIVVRSIYPDLKQLVFRWRHPEEHVTDGYMPHSVDIPLNSVPPVRRNVAEDE